MFIDELITQFESMNLSRRMSDQDMVDVMMKSLNQHVRGSTFFIDPKASLTASPLAIDEQKRQRGAINYVKAIHALQQRQDPNNLKPIVMFMAADGSQAVPPLVTDHQESTAWMCVVLIPKHYTAPHSTRMMTHEDRLYCIGTLPHKIPADLVMGLKFGMHKRVVAPDGRVDDFKVEALFPDIAVKVHVIPADLSDIRVQHSALLSVCHALLLIQTGEDDYLNEPLDLSEELQAVIQAFSQAHSRVAAASMKSHLFTTDEITHLFQQLEVPQDAPNNEASAEVDYYTRVYASLNEHTFLKDTFEYILNRMEQQQDIRERRVVFGVPFHDGASRFLALRFQDIDDHRRAEIVTILQDHEIVTIEAALQNGTLIQAARQLYQTIQGAFIGSDPTQALAQQLNQLLVLAYASKLPVQFVPFSEVSAAINSVEKSLALLFEDNPNDYENSKGQRQLWQVGFQYLFEKYQIRFPESAKLVRAHMSTFYKFLLLLANIDQQFQIPENASLYTLKRLQQRYRFIKQKTYALEENAFEKILPQCSLQILRQWSAALQTPEQLLQILALHANDKRRQMLDWETTCQQRIDVIQAQWPLLKIGITLWDIIIQRSFIGVAGRFFEGIGSLPLQCLPEARRQNLTRVIRTLGYLVGAWFAYHAGLYFFARVLVVGLAASHILPYFSTIPVDDETATLKQKPALPIGPLGAILLISFLVTVIETIISQNRQHLINYLGGVAGSFLVTRLAEWFSPALAKRPLTSLHQANLLFLTSLVGHWLGRETLGFIADAVFKIRLCQHPLVVAPLVNDVKLVSGHCSDSFWSFHFWWSAVTKIQYQYLNNKNQFFETQCHVHSHNRHHFFDRTGLLTCDDMKETSGIKLLTSG